MEKERLRSIKLRLTPVGIRWADRATPLYLQKLALTSPTSDSRSVGIVDLRTESHGINRRAMPCEGKYAFSFFPEVVLLLKAMFLRK
jgi:hypothetical protein